MQCYSVECISWLKMYDVLIALDKPISAFEQIYVLLLVTYFANLNISWHI